MTLQHVQLKLFTSIYCFPWSYIPPIIYPTSLYVPRTNIPMCTPQTVMLGGFPPSIEHGHGLLARNLLLSLMIVEWGCDVLVYVDIEENACIAEPQLSDRPNNRRLDAWNNGLMLVGNHFKSTQHLPFGWQIFHPASRRKIWPLYLTSGSMPRLHISPIEVNLQYWSLKLT